MRALLDLDTALGTLRAGFTAGPASVEALRVRTDLPVPGTSATALLPGLISGIPAYSVKVNAKFPGSVPALRGLICLHPAEDGTLLAVMDSAEITAWRTGLAAALATDALGVIGRARRPGWSCTG
jgi:alanine dehydrogenase